MFYKACINMNERMKLKLALITYLHYRISAGLLFTEITCCQSMLIYIINRFIFFANGVLNLRIKRDHYKRLFAEKRKWFTKANDVLITLCIIKLVFSFRLVPDPYSASNWLFKEIVVKTVILYCLVLLC